MPRATATASNATRIWSGSFRLRKNTTVPFLGSLLDHGLAIAAYPLKIRQNYLLPIGAPLESQTAQAEAGSAAVGYGAHFHDLIKYCRHQGPPRGWHPWHGRI
ncbi:TraI domain-containing protein [Pseudomonas oryzihabitans]|uniref:Uncharacterized domain-containing protein n=1 Tax=Pseudomonas oryzihabitans TaxID=47885 RepID=A0ABX3ITH9_9PSED|nr:hypothetical protein BVL52_11015 [Pseudomonas psychrotolerans]